VWTKFKDFLTCVILGFSSLEIKCSVFCNIAQIMSFETDVSGLTIGPIFNGQAAHDEAGDMQLK
jgi:hypothetical protein